jgi:hypothetical protein
MAHGRFAAIEALIAELRARLMILPGSSQKCRLSFSTSLIDQSHLPQRYHGARNRQGTHAQRARRKRFLCPSTPRVEHRHDSLVGEDAR